MTEFEPKLCKTNCQNKMFVIDRCLEHYQSGLVVGSIAREETCVIPAVLTRSCRVAVLGGDKMNLCKAKEPEPDLGHGE